MELVTLIAASSYVTHFVQLHQMKHNTSYLAQSLIRLLNLFVHPHVVHITESYQVDSLMSNYSVISHCFCVQSTFNHYVLIH